MIIGHESLLALRRRICDLVMSHNHRSRSCALILRHGHRQRFRIFFPGKDTETLTHFFLDFLYFFFGSEKNYIPEISDYQGLGREPLPK